MWCTECGENGEEYEVWSCFLCEGDVCEHCWNEGAHACSRIHEDHRQDFEEGDDELSGR